MKLRETISWLTGTLQRHLFPLLEECCERPLTDKERLLVSILELMQIERFAGKLAQRFGRKLRERRALARAFVAKAVYGYPTTRAVIEALRASPVFGAFVVLIGQLISPLRPPFLGPLRSSPGRGWLTGSTKLWWNSC